VGWPLSQDYNEAVQSPATSFEDAELRAGQAVANALGIPLPRSGNFADVYEFVCPGGSRWAVKCFTREVAGLRERYAEVSRHLQQVRLPFTVEFTFLEHGVHVRGRWYPVLKMQWVEGLTLNDFVRQYADKPAMLDALLRIWVRMAERLREARIAHGDLQHGNLLLIPKDASSLSVRLIDYDGMFVPALAGRRSGEVGHPNYQHPRRLREATYGPEVDRFPFLLVATALACLKSGGRVLWEKYDTGDNLLFREEDLQAPTRSALFHELLKVADPQARALVGHTLDALRGGPESAPLLDELLPEQPVALGPPPAAAGNGKRVARRPQATAARDVGGRHAERLQSKGVGVRVLGAVVVMAAVAAAGLWQFAPQLFRPPTGIQHAPDTEPVARRAPETTPAKLPLADAPATARSPRDQADAKKWAVPDDTRQTPPVRIEDSRKEPPKPPVVFPSASDLAALRRALRDENPVVREYAAARLGDLGAGAAAAVNDLADVLKGSVAVADRRNAAMALGRIGAAAAPAVPALAGALRPAEALPVRQHAAEALAVIGLPLVEEAVPAVLDTLRRDPDALVRQRCVWALYRYHELGADRARALMEQGRPVLVGVLRDNQAGNALLRYDTARLLARALGKEAPEPTADVLLEMLGNKTIKVFTWGQARGSGGAGDSRVGGDARFMAAEALALLGSQAGRRKDVVDALRAATRDADPKLQQTARASLAGLEAAVRAETPAKPPEPVVSKPPEKPRDAVSTKPPVKQPDALPDEAAVAQAVRKIRDDYKNEYGRLATAAAYKSLAAQLRDQARDCKDDPVKRYALYREARDVAAAGDAFGLSLDMAAEMARSYAVELRVAQVDALQQAARTRFLAASAKAFIEAALPVLKEGWEGDDYDTIAPLIPLTQRALTAAQDAALTKTAEPFVGRFDFVRKYYHAIETAVKKRSEKPEDPAACQAVGAFLCFAKQDWDKGLPLLREGADKGLAEAAEKDLKAPEEPAERVAAGDAWTELTKKHPDYRWPMQSRAYLWYNKALPQLSGKDKERVERYVVEGARTSNEVREHWAHVDTSRGGVVVAGDAYLRLGAGRILALRKPIAGPVEITVVCRVARSAPRLGLFRGGLPIIWWTNTSKQVGWNRPANRAWRIGEWNASTNFEFTPNTWYTLTWQLTGDGIAGSVNGRRFYNDGIKYNLSKPLPYHVMAREIDLEIQEITAKPLE
jgi:hypothetical protein